MAQSFRLFQGDPTVTSSPTEVRVWIEELDYSFLVYGEKFERAEINGEKLHDITRQKLNELGIIRTDHQDIILKAVANIYKKNKVEEQAMQREDQNDKKMPTRFRKQSEHLEHAIDRVLVMISERRRARTLHGTYEQPPHSILTAALELINMVKMILNILERPPYDCMSEFSSLKTHLIKHIALLKHFSEQSDLSHEMESDMIDVCKGVTKICHYIIALPPDLTEPETQIPEFITPEEAPSKVQVPIAIAPEAVSFSMEHAPDYVPPSQHLSVPITTTSSSSETTFPLQDVSLPNEIVPDRYEYFSLERLDTTSNEGAVMMPHDEGNKSETEVSDTKVSENSASSFDYKSFQDLTIIETDTPLLDSGSERCVIDSDSDRGIGLDSDLEQHSKDSDSVLWETDLGSEKCPMGSDSVKHLLEAEKFQMASGSEEDLMESEQHLIGAEQRQLDFYSLKHWMDSDSEKCLADSDSEKYMTDSDNERPRIDSDSEKYPMASASVKHLWKAEKCQMASDSIKRLMESERRLMETEQNWILSASKKYVVDSHMERDGIDSASASGILLMEEEKHQEKTRSERYMMGSDSEPCTTDSDSKRYSLASASVKCLMDAKTFQLSTDTERHWMDSWSERHTMDLNSESLGMASDSVKHMMKAESCQRASDWERFWIGLRSESESCWVDSERQQLDFDCGRYLDRSRRYQHRSSGHQGSSRRCQDDLQKHWDDFEKHQLESDSEKHQANLENERYKNEFESERHMLETEREQCLIQSENERFQMGEERGKYLIMSDSEKEHQIVSDKERHHPDLESEARRLGARRKDNRPQGFWRPVFLSPPHGQEKETEEQHSVQQTDNRAVSRIQLVRYLNDDKIVRFKEVSPTLSDKQYSQQKVKEKHSCNIFPDPNTFMDNKHHRNARRKVSVCKCRYTDYRYQQSFQSSRSQINPIHLLSAEDYTSEVSAPVCHPTSIGPWSAVHPKTHRSNTYALDTGAPVCSKCFVEINNSPFHKCLVNSGNDSNPDCPLHLQTPLDSKYSLSLKSIRHHKTFQNSPLSRSLDPKHPVGIRSPLHQEDSKHSLGSTSYLHCESCSALRNLIGSTVTHNFPRNPQNNIGHHKILGPDNVISTSDVAALESEDKFNFTAKLENEAKPDNETKLVGSDDLKDKANAKDKLLLKVETDHEDETDSEDEKDPEDETDPEDEDNTKDKKDPEDKSDPDNTDPKDSNAEKDADTNNGSDPSGDADPTSGADSNSDGDSNNGTDSNNEPDSNIDNATNNDANSKYSTDSEEDKHINSLDNASGLDNSVDQDCTADFNNDSNPNYTSEFQNGTDLDYTSGYSNGADLSTGSSNDTGPKNGPGPNINGSGIQKNGPGPQNIRPDPNSPGPSNNGSSPSIHDLGPSNSPDTNNNSPGPSDNIPGLINTSPDLQKDSDSNYNARPNNATSHNIAISPTKDGNSIYETKPISAAGHNFAANPNSDSNLDYGPGFTHGVGSNFVVNPNFIDSYADCLSSTVSTVNVTDTRNTTSCTGAISLAYTAGTNCASDTNRDPRFTHVIGSNFVINSNYDATNTHNVHNSIRTSNGNNLSEPELEINSSSSIPNVFYGNSPIFAVGTNYISTPEKLTTSKFSNPSKLDRNYTIFDDHKFGACLKDSAGAMDSASFKDATESKDVPDAKESGFLDDFSEFQYPIGIKDPASLNLHSNSNIPLPSFDIIVEAEPPDVVKFAISSGAVNQFFKSLDNDSSALRAEGVSLRGAMQGTARSSDAPAQRSAQEPPQPSPRVAAWRPKGLSMKPIGGPAVSPARGCSMSPARGFTVRREAGPAASPAMRHAVGPVKEYGERKTRGYTVSLTRRLAVSPSRGRTVSPMRGRAVSPARSRAERYARGHTMSPIRGLAVSPAQRPPVHPARVYAEKHARGYSVSPTRGRGESPGRGYPEREARRRFVSPSRRYSVSPAHGLALGPEGRPTVNPARRPPMRPAEELVLGAAVELTVKPAEGYAEEISGRSAQPPTESDTDRNQNRRFPIMTAFINFIMKAKSQNWLNLSWFRRVLPSFFTEEDRYFMARTQFCAMACTELGHGKCEGWLWKKRQSRGISLFSWKRYWFNLKQSTLYWFSHLNDTKADGFIYLPEFRIDLAPHCRRSNDFQASHARIKNFYFAAECSDEMNYWVGQMLLLAYGSSFGDAAANEEYRRIGAIIYANCILALTREFPVIRCNTCHHPTTIVSVSPTFQYRCAQDVSDEFIYFRPIDAEVREEARKQKHRKSTRASHRHTREGIHQRDLGIISQVVMVTTLLLTKQLESIALIRPKTSGFLHLEKMSVKSPRVPESQLLEVTGIASPEERGKGAAIFVAGVPGDEELDDTEIPILKCTELVHLESLINKCSPSSEHSCPQTPRNLWLESPENAEFQGGDDLEVARSMYPFRERPILRRSWEELLEAPLNSEGLHILQTTPTEEREIDYLQLPPEEENQATTSLRAHHLQALQGPFPLHPQHPKLQRQRSHSLPRYSDVRSRRLNAPELTLNPEETWFFFPSDHTLLPGENAKESDSIEEAWQKTILSASGEHPPINPSFEKSSAMRDKIGIPGDNTRLPRGNVRVSRNNVIIPQINVGVPMGNVGVSMNNARIPMDNTAVTLDNSRVPRGSGGVPMGNLEVPRGNYGLPRGSGVGIPMGSVETLRNNAGTSRRIVAYPLTELSKIGEHRV